MIPHPTSVAIVSPTRSPLPQQGHAFPNFERHLATIAVPTLEVGSVCEIIHAQVACEDFVALAPLQPKVTGLCSAHALPVAEKIVLWARCELYGEAFERWDALQGADQVGDVGCKGEKRL